VRGGGFVWHGEIDADIPGVNAAQTKKTGLSGVAGAVWDYAFTRQLALRAEWERYFISRDSMDLLSLGLRLDFSGSGGRWTFRDCDLVQLPVKRCGLAPGADCPATS